MATGSAGTTKTAPSPLLVEAERLRRADRFDEAEELCRRALVVSPASVGALNFLALLLGRRGAFEDAETLLRKALVEAPLEPVLHNSLGSLLLKRGKELEALACYRRAIELKPEYPEAHHNIGLVLRIQNHLDEALAAQSRAAALRPGYVEALVETGTIELTRGNALEAIAAIAAALKSDPRHFQAQYYMGVALTSLSRYEEALQHLEQAVSIRPESHDAHYALGNVLNYLNDEKQAFVAYRKAIELKPDFAPAHYDFSSLVWTMGRRDLALSSYGYARDRIGDAPDLLLAEAEICIRLNQTNEAEALQRRAIELAPERADIVNALGRALTTMRRYTEALAVLERAVESSPTTSRYRLDLAIALLGQGRPEDAVRVLEEARQSWPFDQLCLGLLSLAYREIGDAKFSELFDKRFIGVFDLPPPSEFSDIISFNASLARDLAQLHTRRSEPFDQTLRGGTQTMGHLFFRDSQRIARFRESITKAIGQYVSSLPDDPGHPFLQRKNTEFSYFGAWSCRLRSSGYHTNHVHPQGWISSAYYVTLPEVVADKERRQGWLKFGESNLELGDLDRPEHFVQPVEGRLVLFPSYFWHGTVPFTSQAERVTIAFDVIPGKHVPLRPFTTVRNY